MGQIANWFVWTYSDGNSSYARDADGPSTKAERRMQTDKLTFLNCVQPLLIDNDEFPEFPYSQIGSSFLVLFHGALFLVSAKHCFKNYLVEGHEVCIPDGGKDGMFLPFDLVSRLQPSMPTDDNDFADIVLMRVKPGSVGPADLIDGKIPVFPIARHLVVAPDDAGIKSFILRGYPLDINAVDHEAKRIPRKSLTMAAKYSGRDSNSHVHVLEVDDYTAHSDGNGMSGGAAIAFVDAGEVAKARLAGIIIRGFHGSKWARIIDARVLLHALEELERQAK
jgi:hypothetical protein